MPNLNSYQDFPPCEWGWSESEWSENEIYRSNNQNTDYNFDETDGTLWCHNYPNEALDIIAFVPSEHNTFIQTQKVNEIFNIICINK